MGSQNKGTTLLTSDRLRVVDPVDSLCIAEWVNNYHMSYTAYIAYSLFHNLFDQALRGGGGSGTGTEQLSQGISQPVVIHPSKGLVPTSSTANTANPPVAAAAGGGSGGGGLTVLRLNRKPSAAVDYVAPVANPGDAVTDGSVLVKRPAPDGDEGESDEPKLLKLKISMK